MCDEWMPGIDVKLSRQQFEQLPRNAAYRYEFLRGRAYVTPRPRHYHAVLDLPSAPMPAPCPEVAVRTLTEEPVAFAPLFEDAFSTMQPFGSLDTATRLEAAQTVLTRTREGRDGPWIAEASFVAEREGEPVGVVLITLLPGGDPEGHDCYYWHERPPADAVARRMGIPHLTWIFVATRAVGRGIGTLLLGHAAQSLMTLGYAQLLSTFLLGNDSSMLWHWRNEFRLLAHPNSARRRRR